MKQVKLLFAFSVCCVFLFFSHQGVAQDNPCSCLPSCTFQGYDIVPSYSSKYKDKNGEEVDFHLFAIKYQKEWFFVTNDAKEDLSSYTVLVKTNKIEPHTQNFTDALCRVMKKGYYKIKYRKPTKCLRVGDIDLNNYYCITWKGRIVLKAILKLEENIDPKGVLDIIATPFTAIADLFKAKEEEAEAEVEEATSGETSEDDSSSK